MKDEFSIEFLQAVSDWQWGGTAKEKHYRGIALKNAAMKVDPKYRRCELVAFRKIDLKKTPLWQFLADRMLKETISAWTTSIEVAKAFKRGVPPPGWQGVIVSWCPNACNVILNLGKLYP